MLCNGNRVFFSYVNLYTISTDAMARLATCENLQGIEFTRCDLSSLSIGDGFLRECAQNGIRSLRFHDGAQPASAITEDAILDYCFPAEGATDVALCLGMNHESAWNIRLSSGFKQRLLEVGHGDNAKLLAFWKQGMG